MLRALVIAAVLAFAAVRLFGVPADIAAGYALTIALITWLTWPAARTLIRLACRTRRRRRATAANGATPTPAAPTLTQINHHHYYGSATPPPGAPPIDPDVRGIPQRTEQQRIHDTVWRTIDSEDSR